MYDMASYLVGLLLYASVLYKLISLRQIHICWMSHFSVWSFSRLLVGGVLDFIALILCSCAWGVRPPFVRCAFLYHPMLRSIWLHRLPCIVIAANGFDYWYGSSADLPHRSLVEHSGSPKSPCSLQVPVFVCILRFESATSRAGGNADNSHCACGCPVPWNRCVPPTDSS